MALFEDCASIDKKKYAGSRGKANVIRRLRKIPKTAVDAFVAGRGFNIMANGVLESSLRVLGRDAHPQLVNSVFHELETPQRYGKNRKVDMLVKRIITGRSSPRTERYRESKDLDAMIWSMRDEMQVFLFRPLNERAERVDVAVPRDLMTHILAYFPRNYDTLCSVGPVCLHWYLLLLSTWG